MNIIKAIEESVEQATGLAFYYDTPQTLNMRLDNVELPCAMLYIVNSGTAVDDNGYMRERLQVQVLFVGLSDLDFDGLQNETEVLDGLKQKAFAWLLSLYRSETLRVVSIGDTARYYATHDAICSAFGVTVTLEELEGVCYKEKEEEPQTVSHVHSFDDGLYDTYFSIVGSLATNKGEVVVGDMTIRQCLKLEGKTLITFDAADGGVLVLYFNNESNGRKIKVNDVSYTIADGKIAVEVPQGTNKITKDSTNVFLYFVDFREHGRLEE